MYTMRMQGGRYAEIVGRTDAANAVHMKLNKDFSKQLIFSLIVDEISKKTTKWEDRN